ncbi:MAG: hypothetical protein KKE09_07965 [Bacteroidetes bacterium]|nr:hypothetical protein [Bacteroidota bacterium]
MKLRYTSKAKFDLESAFSWYERQQQGLGFEFLSCIENGAKSIIEHPEMHRVIFQTSEDVLLENFHSLFSVRLRII